MRSSLSNLVNNLAEGIHKIMKLYNVNTGMIIQNVKQCNETKITKKSLMKTLKSDFLIHKNSLTMISISLFCCFEKVFTQMNFTDDWEKFNETSLP